MVRNLFAMTAVTACVVGVSWSNDAVPKNGLKDLQAIEGLWVGSWGGGQRGEVVFQPVIAELFVEGDHIEMSGFRGVSRLTGTVRLDTKARRMHIAHTAAPGDQSASKTTDYGYEIRADKLTLNGSDQTPIAVE